MITEKVVGGSVICEITGELNEANDEYVAYLKMYPPQGYSTHLLNVEDDLSGRKFTITRLKSCD